MNKKRTIWLIIWAWSLCFPIIFASKGWSQNEEYWEPQLLSPSGGEIQEPSPSIQIKIPLSVKPEEIQNLIFEVDHVDISSLIRVEENILIYDPPKPLNYGEHKIRLVQYSSEGEFIGQGEWTFIIRFSKALQKYQIDPTLNFNSWSFLIHYGIEDNFPIETDDRVADFRGDIEGENWRINGNAELRYNSQPDLFDLMETEYIEDNFQIEADDGVADFRADIEGENWRINGNAELRYNSQPDLFDLMETDNEVDLMQFTVNGEWGPTRLTLGQQSLRSNNLVMSGFTNLGISGTMKFDTVNSQLTGFAMNAEPAVGFSHILGFTDQDHRIFGFIASGRPVRKFEDALALSFTFLEGEGQSQFEVGTEGDDALSTGKAWDILVESKLFDGQLFFRGEYARSRFDLNIQNSTTNPEDVDAYNLNLALTLLKDKKFKDLPLRWRVGVDYQKIGTQFKSLAHPSLVTGQNYIRGYTQANWGKLGFALSYGQGRGNENGDATILSNRNGQFQLITNFTPDMSNNSTEEGDIPWSAIPNNNFLIDNNIREFTFKQTLLSSANPIDLRMQNLTGSINSVHSRWNWVVDQIYSLTEDKQNIIPNIRLYETNISANVQIDETLFFSPIFLWSDLREKDTRISDRLFQVGLNMNDQIIPNILAINVNYNLNSNRRSDNSRNSRSHIFGGDLTWDILKTTLKRPGFKLALQGLYSNTEDEIALDLSAEKYDVMLTATLY